MPTSDLVRLFVVPLNELGLTYIVTGTAAATVYEDPCVTRGIDIVVKLSARDATRLADSFGAPEFYITPAEEIEQEIRRERGGHFRAIHVGTSLKADFYLKGTDPDHDWGLERRRDLQVAGVKVSIAPPEHVSALEHRGQVAG